MTIWTRAAPRHLSLSVQNATDEEPTADLVYYERRRIDGPVFGKLLPQIAPRTTRGNIKFLDVIS